MIRLVAPAFWFDTQASVFFLKPLAALWQFFTRIKISSPPRYTSKAKVICVGNVVVGGTGKTPFAISLMEALRDARIAQSPCFLTKGYGGNLAGPSLVDANKGCVESYGDEALLLARYAPTIIAKDRAKGLMFADAAGFDVVITDDGFQNPDISKTASILMFDGAVGIGNGYCIPAGPCREPLADAMARATACIVVGDDKTHIRERLLALPTFAAHFKAAYNANADNAYVAFSGIGRPSKFFETLVQSNYRVVKTIAFPDHHVFSASDISKLMAEAGTLQARLITTEKDFVRLPDTVRAAVDVLPVSLKVDGMAELLTLLRTRMDITP